MRARIGILIVVLLLFSSCAKKEKGHPLYTYYKKIPVMRGITTDSQKKVFLLEIHVGYRQSDIQTLRALNKYNLSIADAIRRIISTKSAEYLMNRQNDDYIKGEIIAVVNRMIVEPERLKEGIAEVSIISLIVQDYRQ